MNFNVNQIRLRAFLILLVVVIAIGLLFSILAGNLSRDQADLQNQTLTSAIGEQFTLEEMFSKLNYDPYWANKHTATVAIKLDNAKVRRDQILDYSDGTFYVTGVGKGTVTIINAITGETSFTVPFENGFRDAAVEDSLKESFRASFSDGYFTKSEIEAVKAVVIRQGVENLADLSCFDNLKSIVIPEENNVMTFSGIQLLRENISFHVNKSLYPNYLENEFWGDYVDRIFPDSSNMEYVDGFVTVMLDPGNGIFENATQQGVQVFSVAEGGTMALDNWVPSREGYLFEGWYLSNDSGTTLTRKVGTSTAFTSDAKLYAKWTEKTYSIIFKDGKTTVSTITLRHSDAIMLPVISPKPGSVFAGWAFTSTAINANFEPDDRLNITNLTEEYGAAIEHNATITLYTVWASNHCRVSLHYDEKNCVTLELFYTDLLRLTEYTPASRVGYEFKGWSRVGFDAAADFGPDETLKNLASVDGEEIHFYAVFKPITITFTYQDSLIPSATATYDKSFTLSNSIPSKTGYAFGGWKIVTKSRTYYYAQGATLTANEINQLYQTIGTSITLQPEWTILTFDITVSATNATIYFTGGTHSTGTFDGSAVNSGTYHSVPYGTVIAVTVKFSQGNAQTIKVNGNSISNGSSFIVTQNTTVSAYSECLATGSLVTLADGTQKKVEELKGDEMLLAWDFVNGEFVAAPIAILFYHGDYEYEVVCLEYSDGTCVKIIGSHGFFDYESNQFVFIDANNYADYVGHHFAQTVVESDEMKYEFLELTNAYVITEFTGAYSLQTAFYENFMVDFVLSLTPPDYEGFFGFFEMGDDMKYDEEKMQADIEKYGLYTYEEWSDYLTYEQFLAFNGPYLKVSVGKGLITEEQIIALIEKNLR